MVMGQVIAPFGIKGWLRIRAFTEQLESLANYSHWWLQLASGWKQFELLDTNVSSKGMTAQLAGVTDRTQAETLHGAQIAVSRASMPALAEDEFYWADLIGFAVQTQDKISLGTLEGLLETGAADVLVVKGDKQHLIPAALVVEIDRDARTIIADWGLDY